MATTKITKRDLQQDEFLDTVFDLGEWLEKHWRSVASGAGAVFAVVLLFVAWTSWRDSKAADANRVLADGIAAFEPPAAADGKAPAANYPQALTLFDQAAAKAGSQPVGDIARLYRARTLIALDRAGEAVPVLEGVSNSSNLTLAAVGKATLAHALAASGNPDRAATILTELSATSGGPFPPDAALAQLAALREQQGRKDEARKAYQDILTRFPQSAYAADARQKVSPGFAPKP